MAKLTLKCSTVDLKTLPVHFKELNKFFNFILIVALLIQIFFVGKSRADQSYWNELIQKARNYDPKYAQSVEDVDRDEAISLYGQAIMEEPDNPENIKIKHRLAQLYACYSDPDRGIYPNLIAGAAIFKDIVNHYPIKQIDCLQSHIGLGCAYLIQGNPSQANFYYKRVLDFNPEEYPTIKEDLGEEKFEEYLKEVASVRLTSVDTIAKASGKIGPQYFFEQMNYIIDKYPDSPLAERAVEYREKAAKYLSNIDNIIKELIEDLALLDTPPNVHSTERSQSNLGVNSEIVSIASPERDKRSPDRKASKNNIKADENTTTIAKIEAPANVLAVDSSDQKNTSNIFKIILIFGVFTLGIIVLFFKYLFKNKQACFERR